MLPYQVRIPEKGSDVNGSEAGQFWRKDYAVWFARDLAKRARCCTEVWRGGKVMVSVAAGGGLTLSGDAWRTVDGEFEAVGALFLP